MLSVAMTTYNGQKYIIEQLKSIEEQELKVDEVVIFDDCSSDDTVKIIRQYIKESTMNIRLYVNEKNVGYVENFRNAIEKTEGDYIFLCDQDDVWNKDKTKKMLTVMKKYNIGVLFSQYNMIDEKGNLLNGSEYKFNGETKRGNRDIKKIPLTRLVYGNVAPGCTYCFTRKIKELYLRKVDEPIIHDYAIALIGACIGQSYYLNEKTMSYRIHESNSIGIQKKNTKTTMHFQKRRKPYILSFLDNYNDIIDKWTKLRVSFILYLRLPVIRTYLKNNKK